MPDNIASIALRADPAFLGLLQNLVLENEYSAQWRSNNRGKMVVRLLRNECGLIFSGSARTDNNLDVGSSTDGFLLFPDELWADPDAEFPDPLLFWFGVLMEDKGGSVGSLWLQYMKASVELVWPWRSR